MKDQNKTTQPARKAVALSYQPEAHTAPRLVAKGTGEVADRILKTAGEHGVSIREDASLVEVLSKLELQEEIPAELYQVVAEVLTFVYRTDHTAGVRRRHDEIS
jgi:flagellar biosynthesis protein